MNVIIGMTDMVLDGPLEPEARDGLRRVRAAALALLGLLNDILDLSKVEAGKVTLEVGRLDLRAMVREITELFAPSAAAKGLRLVCRLDDTLPPDVLGDGPRLRQVLTNLIGNAIKFTERGEVAIEVRAVRETAAEAEVSFTVRDTGIGIAAERQAAVFETFTQADDATSEKYGGTGLGLAISRQLVELMGGALRLASAPRAGSTFSFTLVFATPAIRIAIGRSPTVAGTSSRPATAWVRDGR
jgi:signal transduction histidine kinase